MTSFVFYEDRLTTQQVSLLYSTNDICYHPDTKILTDKGYIEIKKLKRGDLVETLNGLKPIAKVIRNYNLKNVFVKFPKDCFGKNIPNEDLYITNDYYLSENFIGKFNVSYEDINTLYVYHIVLDTHQVIFSNNLTTTSLPPITNYHNYSLKKEEYFDQSNYNEDNIGKHYPPYMLHEDPLFIKKLM